MLLTEYTLCQDKRIHKQVEVNANHTKIKLGHHPFDEILKTLQERSAVINHRQRLTGDAMVFIIEEVIAITGKIKVDGLQEALDAFIDSQVLVPGRWQPVAPEQLKPKNLKSKLLVTIQENLEEYEESI